MWDWRLRAAKGLEAAERDSVPPLAGLPLLPGFRRVLFTTGLFPEAWGEAGAWGSGEGRKSGGQCWARESKCLEGEETGGGSQPCPLPGNIPRSVLSPVPLGLGPGLQGREGHRGLQQALQLTQEVLGNWSQGPVKAVGTMSPTFRCAGTFSGPRPQHLWPGPWQQDILTTILPFCLCPPCPGPLLTTMRDKRLRRKLN